MNPKLKKRIGKIVAYRVESVVESLVGTIKNLHIDAQNKRLYYHIEFNDGFTGIYCASWFKIISKYEYAMIVLRNQ